MFAIAIAVGECHLRLMSESGKPLPLAKANNHPRNLLNDSFV